MPTPFLLAFGFANAPLLYGLAAASVPFIIHLLNRRKFREVRWAAMRFLMAAVKKNSRRIKVEQWLLLAIRTLIVIFIVSAMAKPFLESLGAIPVLAGQRTHRVLVIDGSMSMGYSEAEKTRFDQAKAVASRLVKDARRGDSVSMILMADPPKVIIGDPSPNQDEVLKVIDDLRQTHGGTNLVATFEAIDRVLEVSTIPQKEVIFLTDLQTTSWRNADGGDDAALKRVVARVEGRRPRSVVIDLGKVGSDNRAVTELKVTTPIVTVGAPTLTRAVLHNYGASKVDGLRAKLIIDGTLGGKLPWGLVLIGVLIAVVLELVGVASLSFAVGLYLPIPTSGGIFLGGAIRWLVDRKRKGESESEAEFSPGMLMASGLIAGGAIAGVLQSGLLTAGVDTKFDLSAMLPNVLAGNDSWWPMIPLVFMMAVLYYMGAFSKKPASKG